MVSEAEREYNQTRIPRGVGGGIKPKKKTFCGVGTACRYFLGQHNALVYISTESNIALAGCKLGLKLEAKRRYFGSRVYIPSFG